MAIDDNICLRLWQRGAHCDDALTLDEDIAIKGLASAGCVHGNNLGAFDMDGHLISLVSMAASSERQNICVFGSPGGK